MKKIKSIALDLSCYSNGLVNYGATEEKYARDDVKSMNGNLKLAKTAIFEYVNEKGEVTQRVKVKVSSNCLRNALFNAQQPFQTSHLFANIDGHIFALLATRSMLTRGYLFALEKGRTVKRKSPLMISDAVQNNDSILKLEACSTSGARTDTSFYMQDSVGDVSYQANAVIDIGEMAFLSCDSVFDRPAFDPDDWPKMKPLLERELGCKLPEKPSYYTKKTSDLTMGELGILLPKEAIKTLVSYLINNILDLQIQRANGHFRVLNMKVFNQYEGNIGLRMSGEPSVKFGVDMSSEEDIENYVNSLDFSETYRPSTDVEAGLSAEYLEAVKKANSVKKDEKEAKAAKKKADKAKKKIEEEARV